MRYILVLLLLSLPSFAGTVNCTNNPSTDIGAIQASLNSGGTTTVNGPCNVNGQLNITVANTIFRAGTNAVLTETTNGNVILNVSSVTGVVVNGIDFQHGIINHNSPMTGYTFTNNIIANVTGGSFPGGGAVVSNGFHSSTITGNTIDNAFSGGYTVYGNPPYPGPVQPACWQDYQGMDGTVFSHNRLTRCANDGFHINPGGSITATSANEFSYNYCANTHRACYEIQAFMGSAPFVMKGNVAINFNGPFFDSFGYSMASVGTAMQFINNLGTLNSDRCEYGVATFLEIFPVPTLVQGNVSQGKPTNTNQSVCYIDPGGGGSGARSWDFSADNLGNGTTNPSNTDTYNNNIMCGNSIAPGISHENNPSGNHNVVETGDYKNPTSCPNAGGGLAVSNVAAPVYVSPPTSFPTGGSGTWNLTEISALPISNVSFYIDGSSSPIVFQEIQDVSSSFGSNVANGVGDLKWLYHATFNTSSLSNGSHTIQAIATDVLGATNSVSSNFTVGTGTSPIVSFSPTSLAFGAQQTSTSSVPSVITLTNTGTAVLVITSITPSGDYSRTTTCGSTLAAGANCTISVTFTPTTTGTRTGAITMVDNATGSPHAVSLTGMGIAGPSRCPGSLLANCDFQTGQPPWVVNISPYGTFAVDNTGPGGISVMDITATAAVPIGANIETLQDDITLVVGHAYSLSFLACTTRTQQINVLVEQQVPPFTNYGLMYQPIISSSACATYATSFVATGGSASDVRFTIQNDNAVNGDNFKYSNASILPIASTPITINSTNYLNHSVVQLVVTSTNVLSGNSGSIGRVRKAVSPATCTGGTGGVVDPMEIGPTFNVQSAPGNVINVDVAGLSPSTSYQLCPEFSYDGGATWTSGVGASVTTPNIPSVHPELPIAPSTFNTTYPNTSGFTDDHTITTACASATVGAAYTNAVNRQATTGTRIFIPAGTICGPTGNFDFSINPVDVNTWTPSNVNTSTGQITLGNSSGLAPTLQVGDGVRFAMSYKANDTYPACISCEFGNGLVSGQVFYIASVSAGNVVTIACNNNGVPGATMTFTTQGVAPGGFYWVPAVRTIKPIIFLSDGMLPPAGTSVTPAWSSQLWTLQSQAANLNSVGAAGAVLSFTDADANNERLVSNIWIVGAKITTVDSSEAHTSSDPTPFLSLIYTQPFDDNIVLDRDLIGLPDTPNRINTGLTLAGYGASLQNSHVTGVSYFHSEYTGLAGTLAGHVATFSSGVENMGAGNISVPGFAATFAGTGTGQAFVGLDMTASNALTVWVPSGSSAACSPSCVQKTQSGTVNGTCLNSDAWQKNGSGNPTVGEIACIPITSGNPTSIIAAQPWVSQYDTEGSNFGLLGLGPGPIELLNNFSSCVGLCYHADDGGVTSNIRGDYTYSRNYFLSDFKYMFNPSNTAGNPLSNGLGYYMRQPCEWKGGRRISLYGNIFDGNWNEVEASAGACLFTSVNGMGITDVDIQNNTVLHGPGIFSMAFVTAGSNFKMTPPVLRYRLSNNLAWDIGNALFFAGRQAQAPPGWVGEGPNATQDIRIEHNSFVGNIGANPAVMWSFDTNTEGVLVANNLFYINSTNQGLAQDGGEPAFGGCPNINGKIFADCKFTPSYVWQNNLMIGNGQTPSAVATAWPTLSNYFQTGSSSLFTVGWNKYIQPSATPFNGNPNNLNFCLSATSLWNAGSTSVSQHSSDVGADCDALDVAQGKLRMIGTPNNLITTTGFTVSYVVPDSAACYVGVATTNDITAATFTADGGGVRSRNFAVTGKTTGTIYYYFVSCQGNSVMSQDHGQVKTR